VALASLLQEEDNMKNIQKLFLGGIFAGSLMAALAVNAHGKDKFHVPPGHQPPAGKCRIWFPDRPPGHQPPVGDCRVLSRRVPRGAWLLGRDRSWSYDDVRDARYRRGGFRHNVSNRSEVRHDVRQVRQARAEVRRNTQQLERYREELKTDRAELRNDIRRGSGKREIRRDRREIREDLEKIADIKEDLHQSRDRLDAARDELRDDRRAR
jgi:hypothetical protein